MYPRVASLRIHSIALERLSCVPRLAVLPFAARVDLAPCLARRSEVLGVFEAATGPPGFFGVRSFWVMLILGR